MWMMSVTRFHSYKYKSNRIAKGPSAVVLVAKAMLGGGQRSLRRVQRRLGGQQHRSKCIQRRQSEGPLIAAKVRRLAMECCKDAYVPLGWQWGCNGCPWNVRNWQKKWISWHSGSADSSPTKVNFFHFLVTSTRPIHFCGTTMAHNGCHPAGRGA